MLNNILMASYRFHRLNGSSDDPDYVSCMTYALFNRPQYVWFNKNLTAARIPTILQDKSIISFERDGAFINSKDAPDEEAFGIDFEGSHDLINFTMDKITDISKVLYEGTTPPRNIMFMPACGMAKMPLTLDTHEIVMFTALYSHILKNHHEKFEPALAFIDVLNFNEDEHMQALLFYIAYRMAEEGSTFEDVEEDIIKKAIWL